MGNKEITILLVEDEGDILEILKYNLSKEGYHVLTASNGVEGLEMAKKHLPNLIILDVMMPQMDGIETCQEIRKIKQLDQTIITFLTARSEDYSQLAGFESGADDYITKPIKPKVLVSKVKSLLRRSGKSYALEDSGSITVGDLIINKEEYKVLKNGKEFFLPKKEFELLYLLTSKSGKVFSREEILDHIWGQEVIVNGRTVDVHVRKLREKFGDKTILTIKGVGYKVVF